MLLQIGTNSKLGPLIGAVSIPAVITCPGRTAYCESICYATKGFFRLKNVKNSLSTNYQIAGDLNKFKLDMMSALKKAKVTAVRIHAAGDFFSEDYIAVWIDIINAYPKIKFWAYTRSWRVASLVAPLQKLAQLNNLQLFASMDKTTRETPPSWMRIADLVDNFSEAKTNYVKCPNQRSPAITCEKCTYCFKPAKSKAHVVFQEH